MGERLELVAADLRDALVLSFVFVPDGLPAPGVWAAAHPEAIGITARLVRESRKGPEQEAMEAHGGGLSSDRAGAA